VNRPALLDVSVPMYAAGQAHAYKESCVWIMSEVAAGRLDVAIDTEIVQEILYRYGALQRWDVAVALATDLLTLVPTVFRCVWRTQLAWSCSRNMPPEYVSARPAARGRDAQQRPRRSSPPTRLRPRCRHHAPRPRALYALPPGLKSWAALDGPPAGAERYSGCAARALAAVRPRRRAHRAAPGFEPGRPPAVLS
jgi:hypothetical protein